MASPLSTDSWTRNRPRPVTEFRFSTESHSHTDQSHLILDVLVLAVLAVLADLDSRAQFLEEALGPLLCAANLYTASSAHVHASKDPQARTRVALGNRDVVVVAHRAARARSVCGRVMARLA